MYQSAGIPVRPRVVTETVTTKSEGEVEVYVNPTTYDSLLAVLSANSDGIVPTDIADIFQHRGSFTVICDASVA